MLVLMVPSTAVPLAPQVIIVPIYWQKKQEERDQVLEAAGQAQQVGAGANGRAARIARGGCAWGLRLGYQTVTVGGMQGLARAKPPSPGWDQLLMCINAC